MQKEIERINKILKEYERRISSLEIGRHKGKEQQRKKGKASLSDHIITLREEAFFLQPRTCEETHGKLKSKYFCKPDRVVMALLRLANKKELRKVAKSIDGKTYKAYVW